MKSASQKRGLFALTASQCVMALVIGGLSIAPALARDDRDRDHRRDRHEWRDEHHDRDWRPYRYAQPVYVPPPVYEPRQSPGISLFFPLDLRHR